MTIPAKENKAGAVFICGCGRSGTTYLRTIIDAHPDIYIPTESLFLVDYLLYEKYVPKILLETLFFKEPQLRSWYSGPKFRIQNARSAILRVHEYSAGKEKAHIWGQKTPRFIRHMDLFNAHVEGIKWILIYRDPRAVVASMIKSKCHTYMIRRACKRWNLDNRNIIELLNSPDKRHNVFVIKYEELISNFDKLLKELYDFIGVPPVGQDEVIIRGKILDLKGSSFENNAIRNGLAPQKRIIDKWKEDLTIKEIQKIESLCSKKMEELGYLPLASSVDHRLLLSDFLAFFKDFLIFFEYFVRWPSYLFQTAIRKTLFHSCYWICRIGGK